MSDLSPVVDRTAIWFWRKKWEQYQELNEWQAANVIAVWLISIRYYQGEERELALRICRLFIAEGLFTLQTYEGTMKEDRVDETKPLDDKETRVDEKDSIEPWVPPPEVDWKHNPDRPIAKPKSKSKSKSKTASPKAAGAAAGKDPGHNKKIRVDEKDLGDDMETRVDDGEPSDHMQNT
ncbi:hypothetical protein EJ08DRAFT_173375 [Tothia fuscella]|uniref:Uncharacterized protein n=1 Tax=Tothia fuscella TaxID=1048955 RepID=A0A9P4NUQ5_9PEZI|nr:hypothetical protein EJ08DRAFT_173375 [Tothia fuscella]